MSFVNSAFLYVFVSFGLYGLCRNRTDCKASLAWVPFVRWLIMGKLVGSTSVTGKRVSGIKLVQVYIALSAVITVAASVCVISCILNGNMEILKTGLTVLAPLALVGDTVFGLMLYRLYKNYASGNENLLLAVSVLIPFAPPVLMMVMGLEKSIDEIKKA